MFGKFFSDSNTRKLWKPFIVLFILSFIIINWSEIDWIFNYKFFLSATEGIFSNFSAGAQEKELSATPAATNSWAIVQGSGLPTTEIIKDLPEAVLDENERDILNGSRIEIPRINITAPVILPASETEDDFMAALKKGVLYYPDSVMPGEKGAALILGHSAPPNWPKINYDWIFNDLYLLEPGDYIYLDANKKRFTYRISEKLFVDKGDSVPDRILNSEKSYIVLISCWPPGKDIQRIIIAAELI